MNNRETHLLDFLNKSFLGSINLQDYTDITYNGEFLYGISRTKKKEKFDVMISNEEVGDFLIHMANILGKNFNTMNPFLDITFLTYRLSAVHPIIAKERLRGIYTFSLRIYQKELVINPLDDTYCPKEVYFLFSKIIENNLSILISGKTGSGKTELQKYLVGYMKDDTRIILIEDEYETFLKELYPRLDIVTWITFNNQDNISQAMRKLIKVALRNNPEWLIISEVRGEEAKELYTSLTTGHPLITTIHSKSAFKSIERLAYLMEIPLDNMILFNDLIDYLNIAIHMDKITDKDGNVIRYIKEIVEYYVEDDVLYKNCIYESDTTFKIFRKMSLNLSKKLNIKEKWYEEKI